MKKPEAARSRRPAHTTVLAPGDLTEVRGGTGGTIISENLLPGSGGAGSRGIQGSGHG